jgi:ferrous iron transport protein A
MSCIRAKFKVSLLGGSRTLSEDKKRMDAYRAGIGAFPLLLAAVGERVRVVAVHGGQEAGRKLSDLGLTTGSEVTVASRGGAGSMVVARGDMRLALGTGMAHRVLVIRVEDDDR